MIATTNHLSKLDAALTARPGRFDRIINVGVPTAEARRELLRRSLTRFSKGCSLNLDKAVSRTEGFTGAYVTELGKSAFIEVPSRQQRNHHGKAPQRCTSGRA